MHHFYEVQRKDMISYHRYGFVAVSVILFIKKYRYKPRVDRIGIFIYTVYSFKSV